MDPFILTKFVQNSEPTEGNSLVSLVIFEWNDEALIGRQFSEDSEVRYCSAWKLSFAHFLY